MCVCALPVCLPVSKGKVLVAPPLADVVVDTVLVADKFIRKIMQKEFVEM